MAHTFCIWYRVDAADPAAAERQVRSMMARLACRSGVAGQLMKKRDEPLLWMEFYPDVADPAGFERKMEQALDEYDVAMFIADRRHSECFTTDNEPQQTGCQTR